jgi:hypothetical protein
MINAEWLGFYRVISHLLIWWSHHCIIIRPRSNSAATFVKFDANQVKGYDTTDA